MTERPAPILTTVSENVARISWHEGESVDVVRREVAQALTDHARVEVWVDPDDEHGQRIATWSGMQREGIARGVTVDGTEVDRVVFARLASDTHLDTPEGFRSLLNSFLPRKRAISQMLVRDADERVLLCQLTYKSDWDLPGGVVEVGESPQVAVAREVTEELGLEIPAGPLLLTDWLPPWGGWDDALCLVFDGGVHDAAILDAVVPQAREIRSVAFCSPAQVRERATDFTARRIEAALAGLAAPRTGAAPSYTESGRG